MYIALNSTLVAGRVPWPEFARLAAKTGFGGVDVAIDKAMAAGLDATRELLAETRLKPSCAGLTVDFRKDDDTFRAGLAKLPESAAFVAAIGCPNMITWIMSSSPIPKPELRKTYKQRFQAIAEVLEAKRLRLALEFLGPLHIRKAQPNEFIWRMDEMVEFAHECGPNVGVMLDSWHWHHAGATPAGIVAAGKDRIVYVQLADAPDWPPEKIRDNERLMPGEGIIDFQAFFGALKRIGYAGGVSPEVFGRGLRDIPPEEGAKLGLDSATKIMKRAGVL